MITEQVFTLKIARNRVHPPINNDYVDGRDIIQGELTGYAPPDIDYTGIVLFNILAAVARPGARVVTIPRAIVYSCGKGKIVLFAVGQFPLE